MSTQTEINEALVQYLQSVGYREDKIITALENETLKLGSVSQMQIAKEQGQFLEMITKISNAKNCLEIGRFTGMSTLFLARGIPESGKIVTVDNSDEFLPLAKKYWELDNMSSKIESIIGDDKNLLDKVIPDYPPYGKRMLMDNHWFKMLKQENVELITGSISEINEETIIDTMLIIIKK